MDVNKKGIISFSKLGELLHDRPNITGILIMDDPKNLMHQSDPLRYTVKWDLWLMSLKFQQAWDSRCLPSKCQIKYNVQVVRHEEDADNERFFYFNQSSFP